MRRRRKLLVQTTLKDLALPNVLIVDRGARTNDCISLRAICRGVDVLPAGAVDPVSLARHDEGAGDRRCACKTARGAARMKTTRTRSGSPASW